MKSKKQLIIPITIAIFCIGGITIGSIAERNISYSKTNNQIVENNQYDNENGDNIEEVSEKQFINFVNDASEIMGSLIEEYNSTNPSETPFRDNNNDNVN